MAIWQWDAFLLPKAEVAKRFSAVPKLAQLDWIESISWDFSFEKRELIPIFDQLLPRYSTPWAKETVSWGSDDGDRLELGFDGEAIRDIVVRLDLRRPNAHLWNRLVVFCDDYGFLIYSVETGRFIEASMQSLTAHIRDSRKMKFVQDPESFFSDIRYLEKVNRDAADQLDKLKKRWDKNKENQG